MQHARTQAFKTALRPTPAQARRMAQHVGCQRWSFNNHLAALQTALGHLSEGEKWPAVASLPKPLRRARPAWALELSQNPFDNGRRNLEDALHRYFKGRRGDGPSVGFPSFHKRGSNEAYEASEGHPERIRMDGRNIRLPKVGWVIRAESRPDPDGRRPLQVHVRRDAGRWFVSIVCAFDTPHPVPSGKGPTVGVDAGLKTPAFTADGRRLANPRALKQSERKLRRCDKAMARSRNTHGQNQHSHRRQALCDERARRHRRMRWQRETARRRAASAIAKSAGPVGVESLHVRGMVRNQRWAKALSDAGLGSFLTELAWPCTQRSETAPAGTGHGRAAMPMARTRSSRKAGAHTPQVRQDRVWLYVQSRVRGARSTMSLRPRKVPRRFWHRRRTMHHVPALRKVPTGILRLIGQDDGQEDIPHAPAEDTACSPKPCGTAATGPDKGCAEGVHRPRRRMPRPRAGSATGSGTWPQATPTDCQTLLAVSFSMGNRVALRHKLRFAQTKLSTRGMSHRKQEVYLNIE